jgi:hypothetical protein
MTDSEQTAASPEIISPPSRHEWWSRHPGALELVRRLWSQGKTCSFIANEIWLVERLTATRNAVIGVIHRHHFEGPMSRKNRPKAISRPRRPPVPPPKPTPAPSIELPEVVGAAALAFGEPRTFMKLRPPDCKWPLGTSAPYMFCAAPALAGSPYCQNHTACAFTRRPATGSQFHAR